MDFHTTVKTNARPNRQLVGVEESIAGVLWKLRWRLFCTICGKPFDYTELVAKKPRRNSSPPTQPYCPICQRVHAVFQCGKPLLVIGPSSAASSNDDTTKAEQSTQYVHRMWESLEALDVLAAAALQGSDTALNALVNIAKVSVNHVEILTRKHPHKCAAIAKCDIVWPGWIGRHRGVQEYGHTLARTLQVGSAVKGPKKIHLSSPATRSAWLMAIWLRHVQQDVGLPPLSDETFNIWAQCGWHGLLYATNGQPEKNAFLRQIGESAPKSKHPEKVYMSAMTAGLEKTWIVAQMKEVLVKALRLWLLPNI
jgi:hypothetical protein